MRTGKRDGERGQATVELAIIIPILILVLVGLIEFGKTFNFWLNLSHGASEGARWAAIDTVPPFQLDGVADAGTATPSLVELKTYLVSQISSSGLRDEVAPLMSNGSRDLKNIGVCFTQTGSSTASTPVAGDAITVSLTAPDHVIGLVYTNAIQLRLRGKATMRLEQTPSYAAPTCIPPPIIDSQPSDPTTSTTAQFSFHDTLAGVGFQCRLDSDSSGTWSPCTSPQTYTGLAAGGATHTFDVRAIDGGGNFGDETRVTWVINS